MSVKAEDLGYPPPEVIRERLEALRAQHAQEIREAAQRLARGERRRRPLPEAHRERIREGITRHYADAALSDPKTAPLRRLRASLGLSATEAAERANVGRRTLQRAEAEPERVSSRTWARIAAALGVEPDEIRP